VSTLTFEAVKQAVLEAGFEVFRAKENSIQLAERVRSHLMDANVAVRVAADASSATVAFVVRSQRSDFPSDGDAELFAKVRRVIAEKAGSQGFVESGASSREINDPVDASRVLDVWHELTFSKATTDLPGLVADLQCALDMPKCVGG
jgi:cation transport regulator ChaC